MKAVTFLTLHYLVIEVVLDVTGIVERSRKEKGTIVQTVPRLVVLKLYRRFEFSLDPGP